MQADDGVGFVAFDFVDPKEAMKFSLWAGNEY